MWVETENGRLVNLARCDVVMYDESWGEAKRVVARRDDVSYVLAKVADAAEGRALMRLLRDTLVIGGEVIVSAVDIVRRVKVHRESVS